MAIPLFVKVRPCVAVRLELAALRFQTADGNYLLRQSDFLAFGPLYKLNEYAAAVGGVVLRDADAAANYKGIINTPLPEPLDPMWFPDPDTDDPSSSEVHSENNPAASDIADEPALEVNDNELVPEEGECI